MAATTNKKVKIGEFDVAMNDILVEFQEASSQALAKAVDDTAKETVKKAKEGSKIFGGSGKYARGWTSRKTEDTYAHHRRTVFHGTAPGLPHLLEHGHRKFIYGHDTGGTVLGRPHLPKDEETERTFTEKLERAIEEGY
ncbi:MAG: hypothetical protein IJ225_10490 [Solobacterium sp.]|nr:hypothetical protein [Solobacterium sp.]